MNTLLRSLLIAAFVAPCATAQDTPPLTPADRPAARVAEIAKDAALRLTRGGTDRDRAIGRRELVGLGTSAIPTVEILARDARAAVRREAIAIRGEIADPGAVPRLAGALGDRDWSVRVAAAVALGRLPEAPPSDPLVAALHDPIWAVRAAVAWSLRTAAPERAVESLAIARRDDSDRDVRDAAFESLRAISSPLAAAALASAFSSLDDEQKVQALRAITACGDSSTIPFLNSVLGEPHRLLRFLALRRLVDLGDRSGLAEVDTLADLLDAVSEPGSPTEERRVASSTLISIGTRVRDPILARLRLGAGDRDFQTEPLLAILGSVSGDDWIDVLTALPSESDLAFLRPAIYRRLGNAQERAALPFLVAESKASRNDVERRALVEALCRFDDPAIRAPLVAALGDAVPEIALRAAERLLEFGDPVLVREVGHAIAKMRDPALVCRALGLFTTVTTPEAVTILLPFLDGPDGAVREAALGALSPARGDSTVAPLLRTYRGFLVHDSDLRVRKSIVNNLGILGGPEAVAMLLKVLRYEFEPVEVRHTALQRLAVLHPDGFEEELIALLSDVDEALEIRVSAARALGPILASDRLSMTPARAGSLERLLRSTIAEGDDLAVATLDALREAKSAPFVRLAAETAANRSFHDDLRELALEALGSMRTPDAAQALRSFLSAPGVARTEPLRLAAIRALGERADASAADLLQDELHRAEADVLDGLRQNGSIASADDAESRVRECLRALARIAPEKGSAEAARSLLARETLPEAADPDPARFARDVAAALRVARGSLPEASVVAPLREAVSEAKADGSLYRVSEDALVAVAREMEKAGIGSAASLFARLVLETSPAFSRNDIDSAQALGLMRQHEGRYAEAARAYELAFRIAHSEGYLVDDANRDEGSDPRQALKAAPFLLRGLDHFREGEADAALDDFTRALFVGADDWGVHVSCARDLLDEGQFLDLALDAARRANELSPGNAEVMWTLADAQERTGALDTASATLRRLLLDAPVTQHEKARTLLRLASVYVALGRKPDALATLDRALSLDHSLRPEIEASPDFVDLRRDLPPPKK
ncbi:MAG: HEAT repeat domain-containing protein [Planctomycetes bacterium]|nr:HEAT repeat domain-containing protein [Planctomycetota bacterium]MBI3846230.1 HEAT repeat domain-containing protein [Planctomycetota bacterium]